MTAGEDKKLRDYCDKKGVILNIIGLDVLGNEIFMHYPIVSKDHLGVSVGTGQITSIDSFVQSHDNNKMSAPLNTEFRQRIEHYIDIWKERIKQEEMRELLEDWF